MAAAALKFYSSRLSELDRDPTREARDVHRFYTARMTVVASALISAGSSKSVMYRSTAAHCSCDMDSRFTRCRTREG